MRVWIGRSDILGDLFVIDVENEVLPMKCCVKNTIGGGGEGVVDLVRCKEWLNRCIKNKKAHQKNCVNVLL